MLFDQPLSVEVVSDFDWINRHCHLEGDVCVQLADGTVTLPMQMVCFNGIFWRIYTHFGIPVCLDHVFWPDRQMDGDKAVYSFNSETVSIISSKIYNELILKYKIPNYMEGVAQVWKCINRYSSFADRHARSFQVSVDAISLAKLCTQPKMKEIIDRRIDSSHGTKYAEKQFEQSTNDLMDALGGSDIDFNVLRPFMLTKLLQRNQIPQMLYAFGTRSDITDEMVSHPISSGAFGGLEGVEDFAVESLSAKKAEYFNRAVVSDAQYFARRCRLGVTRIHKLYPGSCGSTVTIPFVIDPKHKKNFLGKFVKVDEQTKDLLAKRVYPQYDDDSIELTSDNIDRFVGREIQMWSPFGCKHVDGVCEHCAGTMHQRLGAYVPEDIHIGVFFTTKVVAVVTQKILSTKHMIKTSSKEFMLPASSAKYLFKNGDAIMWNPGLKKQLKECYIRIPMECILGPMGDLTRSVAPTGVSFSKIDEFVITNKDKEVLAVVPTTTDPEIFPYFSGYTMDYLRAHYKEINIDIDCIYVPMKDFDIEHPFLKYTAINDDMVSFVNRVEKFVTNRIKDYTYIQSCLTDFSNLIYDKASVNIFAIELMLRSYLATSPDDITIPVIEDARAPVTFAKLDDVISGSALSTKLSYEGMSRFFGDPRPTMYPIGTGYGYNDVLFGFAKVL